jgi:hypothetical protein
MYHGIARSKRRGGPENRYIDTFEEMFESIMIEITNSAGTRNAARTTYKVLSNRTDFLMEDYINFYEAVPRSGHASLRGVMELMKRYIRYVASRCNRRADMDGHRAAILSRLQTVPAAPMSVNDVQAGVVVDRDEQIVEHFNP